MSAWKRPDTVAYPQIYRNFKGKPVDGKRKDYWIQDLTEEYREEVVKNYISGFLNHEPVSAITGIKDDPIGVEEMRLAWINKLGLNISLICLTNDENGVTRIAGFNTLYVQSKDSPKMELKSELVKKILGIMTYFETRKDPYTEFGCDHFLGGFGLFVMPEFRKQGIGEELLAARDELCASIGLKLSLTFYSNPGSYIPAERAGFLDYVTIAYKDLSKIENYDLPGIEKYSEVGKLMYKLYK